MLTMDVFTKTEQKIVRLLWDGLPHTVSSCIEALEDSEAKYNNLRFHLSNINKKMRAHAHEIVFIRSQGLMCYRLVRLVGSAAKE